MTVQRPAAQLAAKARVLGSPEAPRPNRRPRVFDMHPAVHLSVFGAWGVFVAILATAFMGPDLVVPAGILAVSVVALFATPALWGRVVPDEGGRRQSWAEFLDEGVDCITGRLTAGQALAQILVLPALLVGVALFFAILKATL
jgi:Flp pilus assembly protein TadB